MLLVNRLRTALASNQFFLHFQPIVDLHTRRFTKAEALIRWHHPELGIVSPAEFIPLAEETGLIVPIGDWVLEESARCTKRWRTLFSPDFQVSVNKSAVQFSREKGNPGLWPERLRRFDLPGNAVTLEITESLLVDPNSDVRETLLSYRDAGIQVAIDDFGTGYSSLNYLKRFDIDYLKIDQSFTSNLAPGSADLVLSQAIIAMAHALGLRVIAEGVETREQLALLMDAGCDFAQGYLLSRPVAPADLEALMQSQGANGMFN
jgi:EAL domain-containing protein (putative c-di-GMP-specific phosphodiesterase class I)